MNKIIWLSIILLLSFCGLLHAQENDFAQWLTALKYEALQDGVSAETLDKAFEKVKPNELVLKLDRNQPEFKLTLETYLNRAVSTSRVLKGRAKLKENKEILDEVAKSYGVQPRFLIALWGVETDFSRVLGSFPVIESLVTLAYDPRRSSFFRKELLHALHVVDGGLATVKTLEGSWAGAFGGLQFLPSVYRIYAQDFNNNGQVDIWHEPGDLFATGANYLAKSGWRSDQTWGRQVLLPEAFNSKLLGFDTSKTISEWQALGVRRLNGTDLPDRDFPSSIIQPDKEDPRLFLVYNNFHTLLKWNRSNYYAVAVGLLSDMLR
nr:lytic murein transglycosylase [Desulfobulbaceae bacterium]